jgi:hypothetical protein
VVSGGDEYSNYIVKYNIGSVIEPGTSSEVNDFSAAIIEILDIGKDHFREGFVKARSELRWSEMARPLLDWAKSPRISHGPGSEFFEATIGKASPRERPKDFNSLLHRALSKLRK